MELTLRSFTVDDVPAAGPIMDAAYGPSPQRRARLQEYIVLQPDGWVLALADGHAAGMGGFVDYGTLAYIGLIAVHPMFQRRGIARAVMQELLDRLMRRGNPLSVLDASAMGAPLYQQLGFVDIEQTYSFTLDGSLPPLPPANNIRPLHSDEFAALVDFDTAIFGACRADALQTLVSDTRHPVLVCEGSNGEIAGYLILQSHGIGPWLAHTDVAAERLLSAALTYSFEGPPRIIVPEANSTGIDLVRRYGFKQQRTLRHMQLGSDQVPGDRSHIYALANFSLG